MILFMILALIVIFLLAFLILGVGIIGSGFLIVFGDVVVCVFIIVMIIKHIFCKKKK